MVLLDTSVVLDVLQDDPVWATWSIAQMRAHAQLHALVINPVSYAELSAAFSCMEALDEVLAQLQLAHSTDRGHPFQTDRGQRSGGSRTDRKSVV